MRLKATRTTAATSKDSAAVTSRTLTIFSARKETIVFRRASAALRAASALDVPSQTAAVTIAASQSEPGSAYRKGLLVMIPETSASRSWSLWLLIDPTVKPLRQLELGAGNFGSAS